MPEIDGDRKHTMRAVPTGAGGSAPDVRQGALGGRRARLDVVTSGSGSGRAFPARPRTPGRVDTHAPDPIARSEMFLKLSTVVTGTPYNGISPKIGK
jgi:hypothetical protein